MVAVCGDHGDWEACADEGEYLHCRDEYGVGGKAWACINTEETCPHGSLARYELKIPEDTNPSPHTVLSFRWDTYENNEVFSGCADAPARRRADARARRAGADAPARRDARDARADRGRVRGQPGLVLQEGVERLRLGRRETEEA